MTHGDTMGDDNSKSRNVGTRVHANDHMTVKHIQTGLAASERQQQQRQMTTAHLTQVMPATSGTQASGGKPAQSVPSTSPAQKPGK
jgi:hypothetical protein